MYCYIRIAVRPEARGAGAPARGRARGLAAGSAGPGVPGPQGAQGHGSHVGRNHVGRFTRTGCTGMLVQVHGLHH